MSKIVLYETDAIIPGETGVHKLVARTAGLHEIRPNGEEHPIGDVAVAAHVAEEDPHPQYALTIDVATELASKVDKVTGFGLSANDYTTVEKTKLAGVATAATANSTDADLRARSSHTGTQAMSTVDGLGGALDLKIAVSEKGAANGIVPLGADAKIAAAYLPSYVDDVQEYANLAAFPGTGESGKIYIDLATGKTWRWGGSTYSEISASPGSTDAVTEGVTNLYFTFARVRDAVLTGLSLATSTAVAATDSVLTAIGKLQAQLGLKANLTGAAFTGSVTVGDGTGVKSLGVLSGGGADIYVGQSGGTTLFGIANTAVVGVFNASAVPIGIGSTASQPLIFGTGNAERARFSSSGNFLVGTSTDNGLDKLQVTGSANVTGLLASGGGSFNGANSPTSGSSVEIGYTGGVGYVQSYARTGGAYTPLNLYGMSIGFGTGATGAERMRVTASGNVLIGTSTDDGNNKFQVAGGVVVSAGTTGSASHMALTWDSSGGNIQSYLNKPLCLNPLGNRVLIGTAVDNGTHQVQVAGSGKFDSHVSTTSLRTSWNAGSGVHALSPSAYLVQPETTALIRSYAIGPDAATFGAHTHYVARTDGAVQVTIHEASTGNVSIGTSTDNGSDKLQVAGNASVTGQATLNALTVVGTGSNYATFGSNDPGGCYMTLRKAASLGGSFAGYIGTDGGGVVAGGGGHNFGIRAAGDLFFMSAAGERMRISSAGNVLIGTSIDNGTDQFQVAGSGKFQGKVSATKFSSLEASALAETGVSTPMLTLPNGAPETYLISASVVAFFPEGYSAFAIALTDNGFSRVVFINNGANLTISVSNLTVSVTQTSGLPQTISITATRIG